jgi:phosphomannomutase
VTQRILSISGLRGVIGDGLDPAYAMQFASAFGSMADQGPVVVARDGRPTGPMLKHAVLSALCATGCSVIDAGIASTPTCGVLVDHLKLAGGLQITASHNPIEWNGLKPFSAEGSVFDHDAGARLLEILNSQAYESVSWDQVGNVEILEDASAPHLARVINLVDVAKICRKEFSVVLDCNHGSGAVLGPRLLTELGCKVHVLGGRPDGRFEHVPEPLKENLHGLCESVIREGADVGFAQDPDADRLAVVDNQGRYLGEELTLALCADHVLSERPGPVVVNNSTSRASADIAAKYDCPFLRSHVGEANVVAKMKEQQAVLGGEGNGGVIEPRVGYVRDSFVGMAYVLAGLATRETTLADWADSLPQYTIVKNKLTCPRERVELACAALKRAYASATTQEGDGLRLDWDDRWVQVRASNTEPIIRVIAEAPDSTAAEQLCTEAVEIVRVAVG